MRRAAAIGFDFDKIIDRRHTTCEKWDKYAGTDVIPMWVADMDFQSPPPVMDALRRHIEHGIFGYQCDPQPELVEVVLAMLKSRYDWEVEADWLIWIPGLVTGLNLACRATGEEDDEVISLVPIYPPFLSAPRFARRRLVAVDLCCSEGRWLIDFEALGKSIPPHTRLLLLCNPHNPVGRVFCRDELLRLCEVCLGHDIVICSDEIHCDLILDDLAHIPTATLSPAIAERTITLMAPSKTYNIPGLGSSVAIISNPKLRRMFWRAKRGVVPHINTLGFTAALAAWRDGEPWREALLDYLRENRNLVTAFVNDQLPGLSMTHVEATYLAWINAQGLELADPEAFFETAGVGLSGGAHFQGNGYLRLNFGCPRPLLQKALNRMKNALDSR